MKALALLFLAGFAAAQDSGDFPRDQRPGGRRDMDLLMRTVHAVTLTRMVGGVLRTVTTTRAEVARCCPSCVNLDGRHYYDSVRTADRDVVNSCASHSPIGTVIEVNDSHDALCRRTSWPWPDKFATVRGRYRLSRQSDGVHVGLKIRLRFPSELASARRDEMFRKTVECVGPAREIWARYGISLDLAFDREGATTPGDPHRTVLLTDDAGRSYDDHYQYRGLFYASCMSDWVKFGARETAEGFCERLRQQSYCLRIIHETGHALGLDDEYADSDCPDRRYVSRESNPTSPMNDDTPGLGNIDFYPRHMRAVVGRLCRD